MQRCSEVVALRNKGIIISAVFFGVLTTYFAYDYLIGVEKKLTDDCYGQVVVTAADISVHTVLTAGMLEIKELPVEYIHPLAVKELEDGVGRAATAGMVKGEQLLTVKTAKQGDVKEGLAYVVPEGKRALTLPVDEVSGIAGLIKPGDHIDVVAVVNVHDRETQKEIPYGVVLLQNLQVLAVDKELESKDKIREEGYTTVTVAVEVKDALPLVLAGQKGTVHLILRSPFDKGTTKTTPFEATDFLKAGG